MSVSKAQKRRLAIYLALTLAFGFLAFFVFAPRYAITRARSHAAALGIDLEIDGAQVRPTRVRFEGVRARFTDDSTGRLSARSVDVTLHRLRPVAVTVDGSTLELEGAFTLWKAKLAALSRRLAHGENRGAIARVTLHLDSLVWKELAGPSSAVRASGIAIAQDRKPTAANESTITIERLELSFQDEHIGPFGLAVKASGPAVESTLRPLATPSAYVTSRRDGTSYALRAHAPKSALGALGLPPELVGFGREANAKVGFDLEVTTGTDGRQSGKLSLEAEGLRLAMLRTSAPLTLGAAWKGQPSGPMALRDGRFRLGDVSGTIEGRVLVAHGGVRVEARLRTAKVPCQKLLERFALQIFGFTGESIEKAVGAWLQPLGVRPELPRVSGSGWVEAEATVDTHDLEHASLGFKTENNCRWPNWAFAPPKLR